MTKVKLRLSPKSRLASSVQVFTRHGSSRSLAQEVATLRPRHSELWLPHAHARAPGGLLVYCYFWGNITLNQQSWPCLKTASRSGGFLSSGESFLPSKGNSVSVRVHLSHMFGLGCITPACSATPKQSPLLTLQARLSHWALLKLCSQGRLLGPNLGIGHSLPFFPSRRSSLSSFLGAFWWLPACVMLWADNCLLVSQLAMLCPSGPDSTFFEDQGATAARRTRPPS